MPHRGKVKWFSSAKGYGFIQPDEENEEDIFVHFSGIVVKDPNSYRELHSEDVVEYDKTQGQKGWQAVDVHVISSAGPPREDARGGRRDQHDHGRTSHGERAS